jgi:hypothetical protein
MTTLALYSNKGGGGKNGHRRKSSLPVCPFG